MASLSEIDAILLEAGIDEEFLNAAGPHPQPIAQVAYPNYPESPIGQGMPLNDLAADIGKVYLAIFNEYLVHRYGLHWPMTIYFKNNGCNPWDMTLVTPNPVDHMALSTANGPNHPHRYQEIHDTLRALADEWSIGLKFL